MKSYLILLPIFLLALLQGAVLPLNLVLLVVLVWTLIRPLKESLTVAFFSGIFLDLAKGSPLGFSSVVLLTASFILLQYSRRFDPRHRIVLPIFVFLVSLVWNLFIKEPWFWESMILAVLTLMSKPMIKFYQEEVSRDKLRLKI